MTSTNSALDNRFLSLNDERFVDDLLTDLSDYLERSNPDRVLLFPPLNGYNRLLIHKTVESEFSDLITFSVGIGVSRRTVVAFRVACCRGPRGILIMNSPGSPMQRGRGRGRQKEMSSSERVTNWVNQREAKRLNKERWASRGSGESSHTGEERHDNDLQLTKQEAEELESGQDRNTPKRYNVQLYIPPSLRAKKESELRNGMLDPEESDRNKAADNENEYHNSETTHTTHAREGNVFKSDCEDQQQLCATSRVKQRGRGKRKPEVEIYVPRALRTGRNENKCISGIQAGNDIRCVPVEAHKLKDSVNCDAALDRNTSQPSPQTGVFSDELQGYSVNCDAALDRNTSQPSPQTGVFSDELQGYSVNCEAALDRNTSQPSPQTGVFSDELQGCVSHTDTLNTELHPYSNNELNMQCDISSSQPVVAPELTSYELIDDSGLPSTTNTSDSAEMTATPIQQSHLNTFEFYDPAVIAFLPSSHYVHKSYGTKASYSMGISSTLGLSNSEGSQHVTLPVSTEPQLQVYERADKCKLSTIHQGAENNILNPYKETEEQCSFGNNILSPYKETEEQCSFGKMNSGDGRLNQFSEHFIVEQTLERRISQIGDNRMTDSNTMEDNSLKHEVPVSGISMSGCCTDIVLSDDLIADRTGLSITEFSQPVSQSSSDQPVTEDGSDRHFLHSKIVTNLTGNIVSDLIQGGGEAFEAHTRQRDKVSSVEGAHDEGDSWDALFDDNGDCVDDALITELEEFVGKVEIDKPKINYLSYEPKEPEMDFHGFSHILEIYDFSPDLATCDLISAFREFSSRGFDVKWVDDTHALGIFSSSVAANDALRMTHPLLKLRPMSEASKKGQSKAKHCQEFLQPYKARPETTSIAARRLVAGALGMSTQVSREVREREQQKLKEAKEKRRQERKQKVDIWDGSFGKCAMDED